MLSTAPAVTRLALALALALAANAADAAALARGIPAGFEDLAEGQVEQLDLQLWGRSAGLVPVLVTLDTVQIQEPAHVLEALELSPQAQAALLPALSAPLPRNGHLACRHGGADAGCGYLDPPADTAAVHAIYDEGEGALHLFVARQWLPAQRIASRFLQTTAASENAFLHQHVINAGGGPGTRALAMQGMGTRGLFEGGHVAANWNFSQQHQRGQRGRQAFEMDNAYYRHDLDRRHYLQAGRMDRRNLSSPLGGVFGFGMLPLDRFDGLRVGSSQAYVDVDAAVQASPLTVLLARDARVDAFDGGRLLQTYYLPAGINELDTRSFPFGNYGVTLRIYEEGVLVRSEDAPFDKRGEGADDSTQWFLQAGRRAERGDRSDRHPAQGPAAMAGMRLPLGRDMTVTAGAVDMATGHYAEVRLDLRRHFATQELRGGFSGMRGSDGSRGTQSQLSYRRKASWNVHHQQLRGGVCLPGDWRDGPGCSDALSASMALPIGGGSVFLSHTRRQTWRTDAGLWAGLDELVGIPGLPPVGPGSAGGEARRSRTWQGSYSRVDRWHEFSAAQRIGLWHQRDDSASGVRGVRGDRGIFINLSLTRLQRSDRATSQRRYGVDLRQPAHQPPQLNYSAGQTLRQEHDDQFREISADVRGNNAARYSAGINAQLHDHAGRTSASVNHYQQPGRRDMAYSLNHNAAFAVGPGGFYWGDGGADAGLAVKVDSSEDVDLSGVAAELQVSGLRRQRLRLGERRLLPVPAYQLHRAELQDASSMDSIAAVRVGATSATRSLFLSPGRLLTLAVPVEVTYTFIGHAQDLAGVPVSAARVLNAPVPATEANGGFVADFPRREQMLYLLQGNQLLYCPLQVRERRMAVLMVGAVQCQPLPVTQLPAAVREQARVTRLLQERALIPSGQTAQRGERP
ncbi:TcfC E-set like domain-containing protein [Stenotrophomonas pennii]|uniref:TcfC E-set like domain-containing protein n=1 Tax=Stenotrophomonas lacuserhaii TaxID=2760084 RepID=UPI00320A38C4